MYFILCVSRVAALECILVLSNVHDKADWTDAPLRDRVRSVVMLMLPGIVSSCVTVIRNMDTQNHAITVVGTLTYLYNSY